MTPSGKRTTPPTRVTLAALLVTLGLAFQPSIGEATIPVTTCPATIPEHEKGVLQNDVVCGFHCSGAPSIACSYVDDAPCSGHGVCEPGQIVLGSGAMLDLNGHDLSPAYQAAGVHCGIGSDDAGRCTVKGPGSIVGGKGFSVATSSGMNIVVRNLTVGGMDSAIYTAGRLTADGLTVLHDRENTIYALRGATIRNSQLDGESGVYTNGDLVVDDVELGPHHGGGLTAGGRVRASDVTLHGFRGITGRDVVLRRATSVADPSDVRGSFVSAERRLRLVDAAVSSIASGREPVLVRSSCETSEVAGMPGSTWGVCSDD